MKDTDRLTLIGFIALSEIAGIVGSLFTAPAIHTWYDMLQKPLFSPPNWLFAPVWTTLYLLMGVAAWRVWNKGIHHHAVKVALTVFFFQLGLNVLWSVVFFGMQNILAGCIEILILLVAIIATIARFEEVDTTAAQLLLPYLVWVCYATYLTFQLWQLNP